MKYSRPCHSLQARCRTGEILSAAAPLFSVHLMPRANRGSHTRCMVSVPDWTTDGYAFQSDAAVAARGSPRFSVRALLTRIGDSIRRLVRRSAAAPAAPKSLIYVLCEEYRHFDLWAAYHAFRLNPQARTWRRLRHRNVPWQSEQTVEGLVNCLCPWNGKRTPDANTVGLALVTAPSSSAPSRKKR